MLEAISLRCSCTKDVNRGKPVRSAMLSHHRHRGLLYTSGYISTERLRQLNSMHKAHLPEAHGTSVWVSNPQCAPLKKWRSLTGIIRFCSHFKIPTKVPTKCFLCAVLFVSELKYYSCNNQYSTGLPYWGKEKKL